ncbi:MAG: type I-C CRISPR-associated protein Cas8c/Csd1 [Pseudomonadota bacterium]
MSILSASAGYYDRHINDTDGGLPPYGYSFENIAFALVLDADGRLVDVEQVAEPNSGARIAVPKDPTVTRTVKVIPMFLWDKSSYVLGLTATPRERTQQEHAAFKQTNYEIIGALVDPGLVAVRRFLKTWQPTKEALPRYSDDLIDKNVVFRLAGEPGYIHMRDAAAASWQRRLLETSGAQSACLVSGRTAPIALTHPQIGGVRGAQSSGAALVSFNLDAFRSYGKEQNANAPVSEEIAFKYTAALNYLMRRGSRNRLQIGDATVAFWAEAETADIASAAEGFFAGLAQPPDDSDETKTLLNTLKRFEEGRPLESLDLGLDPSTRFYILGLSPNAARLSVRFWHDTTLGELGAVFRQHWRDLHIEPSRRVAPPAIWQLLRELAAQGKPENISGNLAGEIMRALLSGREYPATLFSAVIARIRSDQAVSQLRASLIKACLVRPLRKKRTLPKEDYLVSLDRENMEKGYRLGRLFAVLEAAQRAGVGNVNASIRDKFIASASAAPNRVFPLLLRGVQDHLSATRKKGMAGRSVRLEKEISEITNGLDARDPFPRTLLLSEQGHFFVGFYHQREELFIPRQKNEVIEHAEDDDKTEN